MEIPLFPLPTLVLFPNVLIPLHIFEERYKLMISQCIASKEAFGLLLLRDGADEESEQSIHRIGSTARIIQAETLPDGRMNILCRSEARFRILRFTQRAPYWKGSIDFFDDEEPQADLSELQARVTGLWLEGVRLGVELGAAEPQEETAFPDSPQAVSFALAYISELTPEQKQELLEMTSTRKRLSALAELFEAAILDLGKQIAKKALNRKVGGNGFLPH